MEKEVGTKLVTKSRYIHVIARILEIRYVIRNLILQEETEAREQRTKEATHLKKK